MYLSDQKNLDYVLTATGLSLDELELVVGRFRKDHHAWPNKFKGQLIETWSGNIKIVHHFTKKTLWSSK